MDHMRRNSIHCLLITCGAWYLQQTAKAFFQRNSLAGLWITEKNSSKIPHHLYRRCWSFHIAMKPFYHWASQILTERMFYKFLPIWKSWLKSQSLPKADVIQAIMGFATEPFDIAERTGALKVIDCPNSHPKTFHGLWQRECDEWGGGVKVPIPQEMFARMERELERADLVLCPSNFVAETMILHGVTKEKCFINPFGVDTSIFLPRKNLPQNHRFISVGTICLRKGHQYLFRAFEKVKRQLPEAELICVGDYKSDFHLERKRWEGQFVHYPYLPHPELARLLSSSSAFVLASVEEGFARVIIEAMAAGLPIVATHESGASTLVREGVEGFIVPSRDPDALADTMIRVVEYAELNEQMGRAAYTHGGQANTWQDYGDRLLVEYSRRHAELALP
jgi:glycosyltransferase involved in cell wall biosynthesis